MSRMGDIVGPLRRILFLWQILVLFFIAAWILTELLRGVTQTLGLPPWVLLAALVTLLAYLPVALVLAYKQEAAERETSRPVRPREMLFSKQNLIALLVVAAAVATLLLASRFIFEVGLFLSIVGIILLGVLLFDCWRRLGRFPQISYGGSVLTQRETRRLWIALVMFSFVLAMEKFGTSYQGGGYSWADEPAPLHIGEGAVSGSQTYSLPFVTVEMREQQQPDGTYSGSIMRTSTIPWFFFLAGILYWFMVVRWPHAVSRDR